MTRLADWALIEPSGKRHQLGVTRNLFGGVRVSFGRRILQRFDQTPESDRYVLSLAGHVLTVAVPRNTSEQPTLSVDGKPVLGSEATLVPVHGRTTEGGAVITGQDLARHELEQKRNGGASWFYWIGGASIINSVLFAAALQWGLVVGLGITYLIDGLAAEVSGTTRTPIYAFLIDIAIAGGIILIGRAARRGHLGWYAIGIVFYALDGLLFIVVQDFLGIAIHAIALFGLLAGWRAGRALKRVERASQPVPA
ncbi:MAG TPA: hypothetical protein VGR87_03460 [Candidatus Limnocylindria bacterium]|nr:hypothetical protein [Candidatus Limnocylindria bacterium]